MNNQFRSAPAGATAPEFKGNRTQHFQQDGLVSSPIAIQDQFNIDFVSKVDGKRYHGQFTVKKLSIKDIGQIGVRKTQLNGGFHHDPTTPGSGVPPQTDWLNQMIAYLEIALVQMPFWFDLDQIYDPDLLGEIFKNATEYENNFFRTDRGQDVAPGSSKDDSSGESEESGSTGYVAPVVGDQVPNSLDP